VYQYTQDPEKIGTYEILPEVIDFYAGTGDLESLGQYLDEHNELTRYMYEVATSAQRVATSAYSVAVSAYDTATEARNLIVQAQGVVASASNTATSAYNIAMSAYALSGVLQEVADYLRDINGEG
jgi:methyl-accepting chemotaxis protein